MTPEVTRPGDAATPEPDAADGPVDGAEPVGVTRRAALWATVVAVPTTLLVGLLLVMSMGNRAEPSPFPSAPHVPATGPVTMAAPALSEGAATACRALLAELPGAVRGLPQRPDRHGPQQNAGYGEPPVTVGCGVSAPAVAAEDFLLTMDGVCWHSVRRPDAVVLTTVDRQVPVQVTVPTVYPQPAQWANEFSAAVRDVLAPTAGTPSGCGG